MAKKPLGTLQPITPEQPAPAAPADKPNRGNIQTVRMGPDTLRALKLASIDRGISQQDIMLAAIRRDLGLE